MKNISIPLSKEIIESNFYVPDDFDITKIDTISNEEKESVLKNTIIIDNPSQLHKLEEILSQGIIYAIDSEWESTYFSRKTLTSIIQISVYDNNCNITNLIVDLLSFSNINKPKTTNNEGLIVYKNPSPLTSYNDDLYALDELLMRFFSDKNKILIGHQFFNDHSQFNSSYPQLNFYKNMKVYEIQQLLTYLISPSHPYFNDNDFNNTIHLSGSHRIFYNTNFVVSLQKLVALTLKKGLKKSVDHSSWCYRPIKDRLLFYAISDTYYLLKSFLIIYSNLVKTYDEKRALMILCSQKVNTIYYDKIIHPIEYNIKDIDKYFTQKTINNKYNKKKESKLYDIIKIKDNNDNNNEDIELKEYLKTNFLLKSNEYNYKSKTASHLYYHTIYKHTNISAGHHSLYKERLSKFPTYLFNSEANFEDAYLVNNVQDEVISSSTSSITSNIKKKSSVLGIGDIEVLPINEQIDNTNQLPYTIPIKNITQTVSTQLTIKLFKPQTISPLSFIQRRYLHILLRSIK